MKTTKQHSNYWINRKIDWEKDYFDTWTHPHRGLIVHMLKGMPGGNVWEVGVGGGANIYRIINDIPTFKSEFRVGGSDINPEAIEFCRKKFGGGQWHCESGDNMMMSDHSVDILLTDMTLIYVDPLKIDSYLREFKRILRPNGYVLLVEFDSKSWWKRQVARWGGYHVYNYQKRLEKLGFYSIMVQKIPPQYWEADNNTEFRSIITAKV